MFTHNDFGLLDDDLVQAVAANMDGSTTEEDDNAEVVELQEQLDGGAMPIGHGGKCRGAGRTKKKKRGGGRKKKDDL